MVLEASIIAGADAMLKLIAIGTDERAGPRPGRDLPGSASTARRRPAAAKKAKGKKGATRGRAAQDLRPAPAGPLRRGHAAGRRNASTTGPTGRRASIAGPSGRGSRATSGVPASSAPRRTTWPAPSTMPATRRGSTGRTPTCPLRPTGPAPKTSASGLAATSTGPTSASGRRARTGRTPTRSSISMRRATSTTPRGATSRRAARSGPASSPVRPRR